MEEETIQTSLDTYKLQLNQVETALSAAGEADNEDLVKLKEDLTELINLTEASLLEVKKKNLLSQLEPESSSSISSNSNYGNSKPSNSYHDNSNQGSASDMDKEFAAFQAALADDDSNQSASCSGVTMAADDGGVAMAADDGGVTMTTHDGDVDGISGMKCRAPYSQDWGGLHYCNAMILNVEPIDEDQPPKVKVLFCNPTHVSMKPCPYFLEGTCKYTEDTCRFSHGYSVSVDDLHEFKEPDYSNIELGSPCLARYEEDDLWYDAVIVDVDHDLHQFKVTFTEYNQTCTVDIHDVLPKDDRGSSSSSDSEYDDHQGEPVSRSESEDEDELPVFLWRPPQTLVAMGAWEAHTTGIGSRLMKKMGYITGQGLGKDGQGRAEPVPIQLLPQGKSLDKIMELKAIAGDLDLYDVMKKKERQAKKAVEKSAKQYQCRNHSNVFDFINKKLHSKKGDIHSLVKDKSNRVKKPVTHITEKDLKQKNDRSINVQLLKTHEEIKGVEKELSRLKQALKRNEGRDTRMAEQIKKKISNMESYLQQLQASEKTMEKHKQSRKDHKKLTVF